MSCITSPLSRKIDRMLNDWRSIKEICFALSCHEKQVRARASRIGYRKFFITEEEQRFLAQRRRTKTGGCGK